MLASVAQEEDANDNEASDMSNPSDVVETIVSLPKEGAPGVGGKYANLGVVGLLAYNGEIVPTALGNRTMLHVSWL